MRTILQHALSLAHASCNLASCQGGARAGRPCMGCPYTGDLKGFSASKPSMSWLRTSGFGHDRLLLNISATTRRLLHALPLGIRAFSYCACPSISSSSSTPGHAQHKAAWWCVEVAQASSATSLPATYMQASASRHCSSGDLSKHTSVPASIMASKWRSAALLHPHPLAPNLPPIFAYTTAMRRNSSSSEEPVHVPAPGCGTLLVLPSCSSIGL